MIKHSTNHFKKTPKMTNHFDGEIKPIASEKYEFENWRNKSSDWFFRRINLSKIRAKGRNWRLFLPRNIENYITVNSDPDSRIQICSFQERRFGLHRYLNTISTIAISRQSTFLNQGIAQIPRFLEKLSELQVKSYGLKPRKNETSGAKKKWSWISKFSGISGLSGLHYRENHQLFRIRKIPQN